MEHWDQGNAEVLHQAPPPAQQQAPPAHQPPPRPHGPAQAQQQPAEPTGTADTASAGPQAVVCDADAGAGLSASHQQPLPPPPHQQPAVWQNQLSSGISFGRGPAATAGGGNTTQAPNMAAAAAASAGGGPSIANAQKAQMPAHSVGVRAIPFTGRGFRLGDSSGGSAAGASELEGGDEVTSAGPRTLRQRMPARLASLGPAGRGGAPEQ